MGEYSPWEHMAHLPPPDPRFLKALRSLEEAVSCQHAGRTDEAGRLFTRLLKKNPDYFDALHFFGLFRYEQGELNEALKLLTKAIKVHPRSADAHNSLGVTLDALKRSREAVAAYDRALALNPNHVGAHGNRGNALSLLNRHEDAIASYDRALALAPNDVQALTNRSTALLALKRHEEALAGYEGALAIRPDHVDALFNRGNAARLLKRYEEALASYQRALALQPHHPHAFNGMVHCALAVCDWAKTAAFAAELKTHIRAGKSIINPWMFLGLCDDPALQLECASSYARHKVPMQPPPLWTGKAYRHDKLRIAYLSGDYRQHATASLIAELLERHDRARFEVLGISFGPDDNSEMRARLVTALRPIPRCQLRERSRCRQAAERSRGRDRGRSERLHPGLPARNPGPPPRAHPGELSRLSGHDGRGIHRLHHRRQGRAAVRPAALLHGKDRASAGQLSGQRRQTQNRRADADATGGRAPGRRLRVLLLQQQLQDHPAGLRGVDAAARKDRRKRAVALTGQSRRGGQSPQGGACARHRSGAPRVRRARKSAGPFGPASPGRPVPRHRSGQRPHDCERCAMGATCRC